MKMSEEYLERGAKMLLEKETLTEKELAELGTPKKL
jgi:ATP-dependent Zn protease